MKLFDDEDITIGRVFVTLFAVVRTIPYWFLGALGLMIGFPNTKITYKSGRAEYFFLLDVKWTHTNGIIDSLEWKVRDPKRPLYVNITQIESITSVY